MSRSNNHLHRTERRDTLHIYADQPPVRPDIRTAVLQLVNSFIHIWEMGVQDWEANVSDQSIEIRHITKSSSRSPGSTIDPGVVGGGRCDKILHIFGADNSIGLPVHELLVESAQTLRNSGACREVPKLTLMDVL